MPENNEDLIKRLFGSPNPDGVLNDVQETIKSNHEGHTEELSAIKDIASGNKALNMLQVADVARNFLTTRREITNNPEKIRKMLKSEEAAAQRGRQDIRKDIHNSEVRIRKDIRASTGKLAGVTGTIVDRFGNPMSSANDTNSQETPKAAALAETIKVAAQPTMLGRNKDVANATRSLGSFTRGISTDGAVDANKIERLKAVLDEDSTLKVDFDKYIQAARKMAAQGDDFNRNKPPGIETLAQLNRSRDALVSSGKFGNIFDKEFLNPRNSIKDSITTGVNYAKGERFDPAANKAYAESIADLQRATGLKNDTTTREEERARLFGDPRDSVKGKVFKSEGFGIDTEADKDKNIFKKMLGKLENIEEGVGGMSGGTIGKILAGLALAAGVSSLFNKKREDIEDAIGYDSETGTYNPLDSEATAGFKMPLTMASLFEKAILKVAPGFSLGQEAIKGTVTAGKGLLNMMTPKTADLAINSAGRVYEKATGRLVEQSADNIARAATEEGTEKVAKEVAEKVAKEGVEAGAKAAIKKVPVIGFLAGLGFGAYRLAQGDTTGAAMEVASGGASIFAGPGTVASVGIDGLLLGRDIMRAEYDKIREEGGFEKNLLNWDTSNKLSTIDRDYAWDNKTAATILEMERDDLSAEDIAFLEAFLGTVENAGMNQAGGAVSNTTEDLEITKEKNMEFVMTNSNNTIVNSGSGNQGTEVIGVAERAGPTSSNHSWQRFQDRVFI